MSHARALPVQHRIARDLLGLAVPVENLEATPGNPRRGNVEVIARSLDRFGQRKPLVARRLGQRGGHPRGQLLAGHHLLEAARDVLGWTQVAVVWVTDDDLTGKAYALADNDALTPEALEQLLRDAFGPLLERTRAGACWYVAAPAGPLIVRFGIVLLELGIWRQSLVWVKDRFVLGHSDYHYRHEDIFYGWTPGDPPVANHDVLLYGWTPGGPHKPTPDRTQDTVWEVPRPAANRDHPTMKPVELVARAIENSSRPGDVVVDVFGGSGSTLIACHHTGRSARLVELGPAYADVICRRWQEHTGGRPVLERTGKAHDFTR